MIDQIVSKKENSSNHGKAYTKRNISQSTSKFKFNIPLFNYTHRNIFQIWESRIGAGGLYAALIVPTIFTLIVWLCIMKVLPKGLYKKYIRIEKHVKLKRLRLCFEGSEKVDREKSCSAESNEIL